MWNSLGVETCRLCQTGYILKQDNISCIPQDKGQLTMSLYVVSFEGIKMTETELNSMKSTSSTFGESLSEPFKFIS